MTAPTETVELPTVEGLMKLVEDYGDCRSDGMLPIGTAESFAAVRDYAERLSRSPVVGAVGGGPQPVADVLNGEVVMRVDADRLPHGTKLYAPASPTAAGPMTEEQKDAARYRWLTSKEADGRLVDGEQRERIYAAWALLIQDAAFGKSDLDAAIDAAMGGIGVSPTGSPEGEVSNG